MCVVRSIVGTVLAASIAALPAAAQVNPAAPFTTPSVSGPIPALPGATGALPDAPVVQQGPNAVHGGVFTWGPDLVVLGTASTQGWLNWIYPQQPGAHLFAVSPTFRARFEEQALPAATEHLSKLSAGGIAGAFALFADLNEFDPSAEVSFQIPDAPAPRFHGFKPVRARWLRSQWGRPGWIWQPEKNYVYADYAGFDEVRLQGARLYCAARKAQFAQGGQPLSLGERVGFSVKLLGHSVDFLVVEPTVALDGPRKFFGAGDGGTFADGAQTFAVPFLFGTRVTPIRGVGLPGFGEARVPVVLVTGDSEVRTLSDLRPVFVGWNAGGGVFTPGFTTMYSKEHHSVGHADARLTSGFAFDPVTGIDNRFGIDADFTLFYFGPLRVAGLLKLKYEVGAARLGNSRILAAPPAGWPADTRAGRLLQNPATGVRHHDGAWQLGTRRGSPWLEWQVQPEGQTNAYWTSPILPVFRPHDVKALTDDDHSLASRTSLSLELGLKGSIGIPVEFFTLTPEVTGSITGTVTQAHVLHDGLMAQDPPAGFLPRMNPVTAVTVRPRQEADVTFNGLTAGLTFYMDLGWLGEIDFHKQFFKVPGATLAKYDSDDDVVASDERWQMRIGTGSSIGDPMSQPFVWSHLPKGGEYSTFDQDVAACLADPAAPPPPPPPCEATVDAGQPPRLEMCLYGPTALFQEGMVNAMVPANVCTQLQPWLATLDLNGGQKLCLTKYFALLCAPTSLTQQANGVHVVSRVWNLDPAINKALLEAAQVCADAFVGADADPADPAVKKLATSVLEGLVSAGACRTNGELVADDKILEGVDPTKAPKATDRAACHPGTLTK